MSAQIACEPLLGQATVAYGDSVAVTVVLVCDSPDTEWEVALWHNTPESWEWTQTDLEKTGDVLPDLQHGLCRPGIATWYTGSLPRILATNNTIYFTVKYRISGQEWQWANQQTGTGNAEVVFSREGETPNLISHYFHNSDPSLEVVDREAGAVDQETPIGTRVWVISIPIPAATEDSAFSHVNLGLPVNMLRWFCLARESRAWLCPRQGHGIFTPEKDAILVSFLLRDGLHLVVLALSLHDVLCVIKADCNGNLLAVARNERSAAGVGSILVAVGKTFEDANRAIMSHAKVIGAQEMEGIGSEIELMVTAIPPDSLEDWYGSFAYCTWNGLGQKLTDEKLYHALEAMSKVGIDFSTLIIDDTWQSIDENGANNFHHRWIEFEADRKTFPRGLKHIISTIRERYPSIKHIAVWHGILGYWNGISPEGALAKCYKTQTLKKQNGGFLGGGSLVAVDADDAQRLYNDFYQFLVDCGVDSVKTDTQCLLDIIETAPDRARFISAYQDSWIKASLRHFSAKAISCMSQTPQIIFHSQLLTNRPKLMVRNSEDFFPDEPASHPWHIFCNAHTNVLTQHLNVLPDWDMFQTNHQSSAFHAAARCISGGPIYFTDRPGEHDINLINQMNARNKEETIILRPKVGKTTYLYASSEEKRLLRIGTSTVDTDIPLLGIFNIKPQPLMEIVKLEHFPTLPPANAYIVRAHTSGKVSEPMSLHDSTNIPLLLSLGTAGFEILTAYPLHTAKNSVRKSTINIAVLGLVDKMTGAAAVLRSTVCDEGSGVLVQVALKAMGLLGIYMSSDVGDLSISNVKMCKELVPSSALHFSPAEKTFKIDMTMAWEAIRKVHKGKEISFEMLIC